MPFQFSPEDGDSMFLWKLASTYETTWYQNLRHHQHCANHHEKLKSYLNIIIISVSCLLQFERRGWAHNSLQLLSSGQKDVSKKLFR
jgi:hypothetical protein